jgi:hypothetical protein
MRHLVKADLVSIKGFIVGWLSFHPRLPPKEIGLTFYIHIFFVSILISYLPFSKMSHMAGVFFSPTRNLANNSRMKRHINPWNYPVKVHTYEEFEEDFHDVMAAAGYEIERDKK